MAIVEKMKTTEKRAPWKHNLVRKSRCVTLGEVLEGELCVRTTLSAFLNGFFGGKRFAASGGNGGLPAARQTLTADAVCRQSLCTLRLSLNASIHVGKKYDGTGGTLLKRRVFALMNWGGRGAVCVFYLSSLR